MALVYGLGAFLYSNKDSIIHQREEINRSFFNKNVSISKSVNLSKIELKTDTGKYSFVNSSNKENHDQIFQKIYSEIKLKQAGLSFNVFHNAMVGYYNLKLKNYLSEKEVLSIADMEKPSNEKRFFLIDLKNRKLLYNTFVSHGKGSGNKYANAFSNKPNSNKTSLGFYVTDQTYSGKHGLSLYLNGMEENYNDKARERSIVFHSADYADKLIVERFGRLGRSLGCPALPKANYKEIIDLISNNTALYIYYPDADYLKSSNYLNEKAIENPVFKDFMPNS